MSNSEEELGSLAQSTRSNDLNKTRGVLLFIGLFTLAGSGIMFFVVNEITQAIVLFD